MALPDVPASVIPKHYEGDLSDFSDDFVQARLDEVVDKIEARWGATVQKRLTSGALKTRTYQAVVVRVAARLFRNPEGYESESEGQYDYRLRATVASGTLWFTDDDQADLTGINPKSTPLPGTVGLSPRWGW